MAKAPTPTTKAPPKVAPLDLLYGVEAIATYLGITERQARHRAAQGQIPTFKMGRMVCAKRSSVDASIVSLEAQAMEERNGERR